MASSIFGSGFSLARRIFFDMVDVPVSFDLAQLSTGSAVRATYETSPLHQPPPRPAPLLGAGGYRTVTCSRFNRVPPPKMGGGEVGGRAAAMPARKSDERRSNAC